MQQAPKSLPLALSGLVRSLASNLLLAWTSLSLAMNLDPSELRRDSSNLSSMSCCCEQLLQSCRQAGCCLRAPPFRVHAFDHVGKDPNQFLQSRVLDPLDATAGREGEREREPLPLALPKERESRRKGDFGSRFKARRAPDAPGPLTFLLSQELGVLKPPA